MYSKYGFILLCNFLTCFVSFFFIWAHVSFQQNSLLGGKSGRSLWAVCHGHVWLHDRHRDGWTDRHSWSGIRGWGSLPDQFIRCHWFYINMFCFVFLAKGEDMESLLFHFLDDWLYKFSADLFFIPRVSVTDTGHILFITLWLIP